jgi:LacI family transcriptional regulator
MPTKNLEPKKTRPKDIALMVDTSTSWGRRIIAGVNSFAQQQANWHIFLEARGMEENLKLPQGWKGDGVIARVSNTTICANLMSSGLPVVNVSGVSLPESPFPQITTDQSALAEMAFLHFQERGFKNFAYFSLKGVSYVMEQRDAFRRRISDAGFLCHSYELNRQRGAEADWNADINAIAAWMKSLPKPVAMLAWNPSSARTALFGAEAAGLMVPEQVSVLSGADDDVLCENVSPAISGILVDAHSIGFHAARMLNGTMSSNRSAKKKTTFIPPLRIECRHSSDTLSMKDPAMVRAISFIRNNANQPLQVSEVAKAAGLSRRILERRFQSTLGRSPATEIRRIHIEHAKRLLRDTYSSIPTVAESAGFCSPEYFAFYFKTQTGQTPSQFRRSLAL